jgi:hypothetical protein
VHLSSEDPQSRPNFLKSGVFDKLKGDFNEKKERCCQIFLSNFDDVESWHEIERKLSEMILHALCQCVVQMEEENRKVDAQRLSTNWNFCKFFILKENLSLTYSVFSMYQEALVQYDELEAIYSSIVSSTCKMINLV